MLPFLQANQINHLYKLESEELESIALVLHNLFGNSKAKRPNQPPEFY